MKLKAADQLFEPAGHIVDDVLVHNIDDVPVPFLPQPQPRTQVRTVNRFRQKDRPKEPVWGHMRYEAIPEGKYKIKQNKKSHLIFPYFI